MTRQIAFMALLVIAAPLGLLLVFLSTVGSVRLALISAQSHTFGAAVLLIAYLVETTLITAPSVDIGLNISTNDVAVLLMMLALVIGAAMRPLPLHTPIFLAWLAFAAIILMNLAIGLDTHGARAGVEIRPTFGFLIGTLYFCIIAFTQDDLLRMARWCTLAGYGLVGLALYRWIGLATGLVPLSSIIEIGAGNEFRALRADAAFFLSMLSLGHFLVWLRGNGGRLTAFNALLFAAFVVVLQHRSAWVAYALGMLLLLVHQHRHLGRRLPFILGFTLLASISLAIAATFGVFDQLAESLVRSVVSVGSSNSTATDRIDAWDTLLSDWKSAHGWDILFGFPFGHGFRWFINHTPVDFQPHNFYVFLLLRTGVCGLLLFVIVSTVTCLYALVARTRSETDDMLVRGLGFIGFAMLVYYIPYQAISIHGALTGLAIGLLIHRPRGLEYGARPISIVSRDTASHLS